MKCQECQKKEGYFFRDEKILCENCFFKPYEDLWMSEFYEEEMKNKTGDKEENIL